MASPCPWWRLLLCELRQQWVTVEGLLLEEVKVLAVAGGGVVEGAMEDLRLASYGPGNSS